MSIILNEVNVRGKWMSLHDAQQLAYTLPEDDPEGKSILHQCALKSAAVLVGEVNARSVGRPVRITGGAYFGKTGVVKSRDFDFVEIKLHGGGTVMIEDQYAKTD